MATIVGYLAALFVVVSIMQNSLVRVRIFMLIGSVVFVIYGLLISALPVVIANGVIAAVSLRYLLKKV